MCEAMTESPAVKFGKILVEPQAGSLLKQGSERRTKSWCVGRILWDEMWLETMQSKRNLISSRPDRVFLRPSSVWESVRSGFSKDEDKRERRV